MLLCLHVEEPVSGFEEGGSLFMQKSENFIVFCLFTVEWRTRKRTPCLGSCVMSP